MKAPGRRTFIGISSRDAYDGAPRALGHISEFWIFASPTIFSHPASGRTGASDAEVAFCNTLQGFMTGSLSEGAAAICGCDKRKSHFRHYAYQRRKRPV